MLIKLIGGTSHGSKGAIGWFFSYERSPKKINDNFRKLKLEKEGGLLWGVKTVISKLTRKTYRKEKLSKE